MSFWGEDLQWKEVDIATLTVSKYVHIRRPSPLPPGSALKTTLSAGCFLFDLVIVGPHCILSVSLALLYSFNEYLFKIAIYFNEFQCQSKYSNSLVNS